MDLLQITKVEAVTLAPTAYPQPSTSTREPTPALGGTLHCTPHHLVFRYDIAPGSLYLSSESDQEDELWLPLPLIQTATLHPPNYAAQTPLVIRTRHFKTYSLFFRDHVKAGQVYESIKAVVSATTSLSSLYAFCQPSTGKTSDGWEIYNPQREFARMGAIGDKAKSTAWRTTSVNADYDFCSTYPSTLVVPSKISDVTLKYGKGYRSKHRVPALVYLHWANSGSITRSSQPMVGLKNARSIQDEKLIEAIFHSHTQAQGDGQNTIVYGNKATNLIIDARPTTNAMANSVKGAGTENMEHYKNCKKAYLGIDNIHVMRDSLRSVNDALISADLSGHAPDKHALKKSGWLRHLSAIIEGAVLIAKNIHIANSHVLVHCSDGWDRTAQLSSLAQLCLDPYYRTIEGFAVLVEKDFLSFGHKFNHRVGHLVPDRTTFVAVPGDSQTAQAAFMATVQKGLAFSSAAFKETSPVFQQFLDCVYQMTRQFPERFEFNERFLLRLQYELYACRYGTFLYDAEEARQREKPSACEATSSVWSIFQKTENKKLFENTAYDKMLDDPRSRAPNADMGVLLPDPRNIAFWHRSFDRPEDDMTSEEAEVPPEVIMNSDAVESDNGLIDNIGTTPTPQQKWQEENLNAASGSTTPTKPSTANPPVEKLQTAMQGLWKFGGSSWKSLKQNLQEYQNVPAQASGNVKDESFAAESKQPTLKKAGLEQLSLSPSGAQLPRNRDASTASSIHFPPKPKTAPSFDPLGAA